MKNLYAKDSPGHGGRASRPVPVGPRGEVYPLALRISCA